jgi:hypothetical protein
VGDREELQALRRLAELEAKEQKAKPAVAPDPTEGMSGIAKFGAGYGKAIPDLALGVKSLFSKSGAEDVKAMRRRDAPLLRDPYGMAGNIAGNIAAAVPASFIPGANTVLGSGLIGGAYGLIQPAEDASERGGNIALGALGSSFLTGVARAAPAIWRAVVSPFTKGGQEKVALDTIARFAKNPKALQNANIDELVKGSRPTLAEATGDPGIAQLQRAAQAASPETASLMAESKALRIQARKDALLSMGDATDKEFFEASRDATAQRLYGSAFKAPIDPVKAKAVAPDIKELLARPSIQKARNEAIRLAKESGTILKSSDMKGGSIEGLHYMKLAVDDMISAAKRAGNNNEVRVLMGTKDRLVGVMQKISPKYATAMAEYQAASKPINQIEVTNYLYDKLVPALTDLGAERLTPSAFAKALKDGDVMAQRATGFKGAKLADILTSEQMDLLVKLGLDLGREAGATARAMVPGSPTAQYLSGRNALRQIMGPLGLPEKWSEKVLADTLVGRGLSAAAAPAENAIQAKLGQFLVNPAEAQKAASLLTARQSRMVPLSRVSEFALPPLAITGPSAYASQK